MEQSKKRIAILHHTGCGNLGDDAIIDAVLRNIGRRWSGAEITIFSMNPGETARRHGVSCYPIRRHEWRVGADADEQAPGEPARGGFATWLRNTRNPIIRFPRSLWSELVFLAGSYELLKTFDLMIVSGGGQLTERGGPWSFPYALFVWTHMAKRAGVRCFVLNVGAGPLNHSLSRFFILRALRNADYISFRDANSQQLLTSLGFTGRNQVYPDNVYSFEIEAARKQTRESAVTVGINPMPFPFSDLLKYPANAQAIQDEFIDKIAKFASLLNGESYALRLFGSDIGADPAEIERLRGVLINRYKISLPEYVPIDSVDELLGRMAGMDYVVTCRYHGVVFAHLLNKPVLAIAHHPKVTHQMEALGLSRYCVDMLNFDPHRLMDTFTELVANKDMVKERMAASLAEYRAKSRSQFDEIFPGAASEFADAAIKESDQPAETAVR
jgi:polysaccharide pyruvyl transferase WcaK-like protein